MSGRDHKQLLVDISAALGDPLSQQWGAKGPAQVHLPRRFVTVCDRQNSPQIHIVSTRDSCLKKKKKKIPIEHDSTWQPCIIHQVP